MTGSGSLLGGYKKHDNHQNDAHVKEVGVFAAKQISEKEGTALDLVKIVSVDSQVVAGKNYKLVLDLASPEQKVKAYEAVVYEPLGAEALQLTSHRALDKAQAEMASEISSESHSGALLGAAKEVGTEDHEVLQAAQFATEQLSQQSNSLLPFRLEKVLQAKQKAEGGKLWELKLELAQGKTPAKVLDVTVSQSLQNSFKLEKVGQA